VRTSCRSDIDLGCALRPRVAELPTLDEQNAIRPLEQRRPVRDHDPRDAHRPDQIGNGVLGILVEVRRALVEEEDARIAIEVSPLTN